MSKQIISSGWHVSPVLAHFISHSCRSNGVGGGVGGNSPTNPKCVLRNSHLFWEIKNPLLNVVKSKLIPLNFRLSSFFWSFIMEVSCVQQWKPPPSKTDVLLLWFMNNLLLMFFCDYSRWCVHAVTQASQLVSAGKGLSPWCHFKFHSTAVKDSHPSLHSLYKWDFWLSHLKKAPLPESRNNSLLRLNCVASKTTNNTNPVLCVCFVRGHTHAVELAKHCY